MHSHIYTVNFSMYKVLKKIILTNSNDLYCFMVLYFHLHNCFGIYLHFETPCRVFNK
jgi:hypothetical protein